MLILILSLVAALLVFGITAWIAEIVVTLKAYEGDEMLVKKKELMDKTISDDKAQRQKQRACFWTRPWGHIREPLFPGSIGKSDCLICQKKPGFFE